MNASEAAGTALLPRSGSEPFGELNQGHLAVGDVGNRSAALTCGDPGLVWSTAFRQPNGSWSVTRYRIQVRTSLNDASRDLVVGTRTDLQQPGPLRQPMSLCGAPVLIDVNASL